MIWEKLIVVLLSFGVFFMVAFGDKLVRNDVGAKEESHDSGKEERIVTTILKAEHVSPPKVTPIIELGPAWKLPSPSVDDIKSDLLSVNGGTGSFGKPIYVSVNDIKVGKVKNTWFIECKTCGINQLELSR
jgi:hypothetical protein